MVKLSVNDRDLGNVISKLSQGKYRIPEFQREFVWDRKDVVDLFDSIYNSYPIGSFFFWRVPEDMWEFFRDIDQLQQPPIEEIKDSEFPEVSFVLDGQQRLTSLYATLDGIKYGDKEYSEIKFNLDTESFKISKKSRNNVVPVCDIWEDKREVRDQFDRESKRYESFTKCHDILKEYKLPVITVQTGNVDSVTDIFERINQQGTQLTRFDIVNANIWSEEFNLRKRIEKELLPELKEKRFGRVDNGRVIQTLALNIEETCRTNAQTNLNSDDVRDVWTETKDAILSAVDYLRNKHGVKRIEFLPYGGMIPVLSYYIYNIDQNSPKSDHEVMIDRWFWRVAVSERYGSAAQTKMTKDSRIMDKIIDGEDVKINFTPKIDKERLIRTNIKRSSVGLRNAFLCLLAKKHPLHFENGSKIDLAEDQFIDFRLENHHIFPNSYLRDNDYSKEDRKSILDIAFIPSEINQNISKSNPKEYFTKIRRDTDRFEEIMDSHIIPHGENSGLWDNDYDTFREKRAELIYAEIMNLIGDHSDLEADVVRDVESALDKLEKEVRDFIDKELKAENDGGYWNNLPSGITTKIENRIESEKKENPDLTIDSDRDKLDYCDVMGYAKIINNQWDIFEQRFPSTEEVQERFGDVNKLRRALKHNREVDRFVEMDGKTGIEWVYSCITNEE